MNLCLKTHSVTGWGDGDKAVDCRDKKVGHSCSAVSVNAVMPAKEWRHFLFHSNRQSTHSKNCLVRLWMINPATPLASVIWWQESRPAANCLSFCLESSSHCLMSWVNMSVITRINVKYLAPPRIIVISATYWEPQYPDEEQINTSPHSKQWKEASSNHVMTFYVPLNVKI